MNALRFIRRYLSWLPYSRRLQFYPPFWYMGVRVLKWSPDNTSIRIRLPLTWKSKNMGESMFGGYQASLADPIAALACSRIFTGYDVWSRKLVVDFRRPGSTDLELRFDFPAAQIHSIREQLKENGRSDPVFAYGFYLADGTQCTDVKCTVAIRTKGYLQHQGIGTAG